MRTLLLCNRPTLRDDTKRAVAGNAATTHVTSVRKSVTKTAKDEYIQMLPQTTSLVRFFYKEHLLLHFSYYLMFKYEAKERVAQLCASRMLEYYPDKSGGCWVIPDFGYARQSAPLGLELMPRRELNSLAERLALESSTQCENDKQSVTEHSHGSDKLMK